MKNLFLLPTDKPSRLYLFEERLILGDLVTVVFKNSGAVNQNIYITSDEEIKDVRPNKGKWHLEKGNVLNKFPDYLTDLSECKLVIMTTDPQLIADGVQAIDDEFLEWFVKNPSCEEVEIINTFDYIKKGYVSHSGYKIQITKEEAKQELERGVEMTQVEKKSAVDWLKPQIELMLMDGHKPYPNQLEEAFEIAKDLENQKQGYSEEDMKQFAFECVANFLSNNDNKVEMSLVEVITDRNNKKFEQFKKNK
jgi:hypothetical protein